MIHKNAVLLSSLLFFIAGLLPDVAAGEDRVDYLRQIKPILKARCFACHGALKQQAGLRLDSGTLIRKGGENGPAVVAKRTDKSSLIERISAKDASTRMPPEGKPLSPEQIALIKNWVKQGAISPANETPEEDPGKHWAFVKPVRPKLPAVRNKKWVKNPIDAFIAAAHEERGLKPLPAAQKHILLRRVYLDLIGLPPTRKQLHAFLNDKSPSAYENVVKRLLKSPQYGERWGRHWMDVWRYSDWYGRRQVNDVRNSYPHIWRWRDWIIQSLNDDKGYDAMIREMLAADELHPADDSRIAALGFIVRNWFSLNYDTWKQDLVEHTGKAFLGLRLNCAHCHDHKYDPISQEEYFRFRAFFEPLELRHDRVPGGPALKKYLRYTPSSGGSLKPIKAGLARVYDFELNAKTYMYRLGDARNRFDRPPVTPGAPAILNGDRLKIEPVKLPPVAWYPGLKKFAQRAEVAVLKAKFKTAGMKQNPVRAYLVAVQARIAADNARFQLMAPNGDNLARSAARAERLARLTVIRVQESVATKALKAAQQKPKPDVKAIKKAKSTLAAIKAKIVAAEKQLKTVSSTYTPFGPQYPKTSTGRRRALANWIADTNNPLTARVAVNHIWMRHFGTPLVQSVFDFGRAGKRPTHPQLLDWLAVELMENRWSMKHIHRLIVTSNTYRMSSRPGGKPHPNVRIDKDNLFLWKFPRRRMQGEIIRDSLLHIAGVLDTTLGGPEIDPKQEAKSFRRSLYFAIYPEAGGTMPFLTLFDPPNPADCYRRSESIVPQQALALSNSKLVLNLTRKLAGRLAQGISETENTKFITAAFEQILSRSPTSAETCVCLEFLKSQTALYKNSGIKSITSVSQRSRESLVRVLLNHNDFVTVH